jgi:hypothetical protein
MRIRRDFVLLTLVPLTLIIASCKTNLVSNKGSTVASNNSSDKQVIMSGAIYSEVDFRYTIDLGVNSKDLSGGDRWTEICLNSDLEGVARGRFNCAIFDRVLYPDNFERIVLNNSGNQTKCVTADPKSSYKNKLTLEACDDPKFTKWQQFQYDSYHRITIGSGNNQLCLDLTGINADHTRLLMTVDKLNVILFNCKWDNSVNSYNQHWWWSTDPNSNQRRGRSSDNKY